MTEAHPHAAATIAALTEILMVDDDETLIEVAKEVMARREADADNIAVLRSALIEAGNVAGGVLGDEATNEFLCEVPGQVSARIASLTARVGELENKIQWYVDYANSQDEAVTEEIARCNAAEASLATAWQEVERLRAQTPEARALRLAGDPTVGVSLDPNKPLTPGGSDGRT